MSVGFIKDFIKRTLKEKNLTALDLSKLSGVSDSTVSDLFIKNQSRIDTGNVIRFANALGCSVDQMLGKSKQEQEIEVIRIDPIEAMVNLKTNLKIILQNKHMSIKNLAEMCNTNSNNIYAFNSGLTKSLSLDALSNISATLGYSIDQLIGRQKITLEHANEPALHSLSETDKAIVKAIKVDLAKSLANQSVNPHIHVTTTPQKSSSKSK